MGSNIRVIFMIGFVLSLVFAAVVYADNLPHPIADYIGVIHLYSSMDSDFPSKQLWVEEYGSFSVALQKASEMRQCKYMELTLGYSGTRTYMKLYDPNGVLVDQGTRIVCPDRSRPGYWTIVFEDGSKVTFYISEKTRGFSVQAICGPASIAGLALLPLGILGVKRRRR